MLIFDMDGTLIDSNGIWRDVDTAFLAKRGLPYTREYYEGVAHTVFPKAAEFTKAYCCLPESTDEIMAEWMEMAGDLYTTSVPVKPQRLTAFAGAVEKVFSLVSRQLAGSPAVSQATKRIGSIHGRKSPQQHGGGFALRLGDKVEAAVHAIDKIDIGMARRAKHGGVADGFMIAVGVGGLVNGPHIRLGLRDAADQ